MQVFKVIPRDGRRLVGPRIADDSSDNIKAAVKARASALSFAKNNSNPKKNTSLKQVVSPKRKSAISFAKNNANPKKNISLKQVTSPIRKSASSTLLNNMQALRSADQKLERPTSAVQELAFSGLWEDTEAARSQFAWESSDGEEKADYEMIDSSEDELGSGNIEKSPTLRNAVPQAKSCRVTRSSCKPEQKRRCLKEPSEDFIESCSGEDMEEEDRDVKQSSCSFSGKQVCEEGTKGLSATSLAIAKAVQHEPGMKRKHLDWDAHKKLEDECEDFLNRLLRRGELAELVSEETVSKVCLIPFLVEMGPCSS